MPEVVRYIFGFLTVLAITSSIDNYNTAKYYSKRSYCSDIHQHNRRIKHENDILNSTSNTSNESDKSNNTSNSTQDSSTTSTSPPKIE